VNKVRKLSKAHVISIVDDDESVRDATESLVRSLGYDAATFASAEEYLDSRFVRDTSCLITDLVMPGMSGVDLQDRLIADGNDTPVIFITACFDEIARTRALEAGAHGFLRKPFSEESLIECLDSALSSAKGRPV
jgi:FixJ family two-component response regulator